jgi:hypothetical protein
MPNVKTKREMEINKNKPDILKILYLFAFTFAGFIKLQLENSLFSASICFILKLISSRKLIFNSFICLEY